MIDNIKLSNITFDLLEISSYPHKNGSKCASGELYIYIYTIKMIKVKLNVSNMAN
jgi:hypothetical protein